MNIGMIHQRTGGNCGVALEMDKFSEVLRTMGHDVYYCTGEGSGYLIPDLSLENVDEATIASNAFYGSSELSEGELRGLISSRIALIKPQIEKFLDDYRIELLIVQNIWAVLSHLGTGIALRMIAEERGLPVWAHNHDFHWEFKVPLQPSFPFIEEIINCDFPPDLANVKHLVINSPAREEMMKRRGLDSIVIPNVIDSGKVKKEPSGDESSKFRTELGLRADDLLVMCGTRIIPHKYIEAAIRFAAALNSPENRRRLHGIELSCGEKFSSDSRVVFIVCGKPEAFSSWYLDELKILADNLGLESRWIGQRVTAPGGVPVVNSLGHLFDMYSHAELVSYTTIHEGWGNQLLEGLAAKKPMLICEYPVFKTDIEQFGFDLISFGDKLPVLKGEQSLLPVDEDVLARVVEESISILVNPAERKKMVEHNHRIIEAELSFRRLGDFFRSQVDLPIVK